MNGKKRTVITQYAGRKPICPRLMAAACAALIAAVSCAVPVTARPQGSLSVSIATDSTARTIRPDFEASIDTVNLTLSLNGGSTVLAKSFSTTNGAALFENLEKGNWTLNAEAFKAGAKVGTGSLTVAISGGSQSVVVPIAFIRGATASAFSIPLVWPASTGVDYATASMDGAAAAELTITATAATASAPAACTATVASSLTPGAHSLKIAFRRGGAAGTDAGTFVEYVNVYSGYTAYSHVKGDGNVESAWNFSASDFLGANANLAGISISAGGTPLDIGFSSATTAYTVGIGAATSVSVTPTGSIAGQYIAYSLNGGSATALASGATASFTPGDANSLAISVRAPDGATTKNYVLKISKTGSANVSFSINPAYGGLTVSTSSLLVRNGADIDFSVDTSALGTVASAFEWYADGVKNDLATGKDFTANVSSAGAHSYGVAVTVGGLRYSGNVIVTAYENTNSPVYDGNGADTGTPPDDGTQGTGEEYTLWDNTTSGIKVAFSRSGYSFTGWNTKPDGSGTHYDPGSKYTFGNSSITFYAQWTNVAPAAPTGLVVNANSAEGYATLSWTDPAEKDIAYVRVSDGTTTYDIAKGTQKKIFTGIAGSGTFTTQAYDNEGLPGPAATVKLVTITTEAEAITRLQGLQGGTLGDSLVLACDVNLGAWTAPIATVTGMFDGGGHTITLGAGSTSGLFAMCTSTSTVKNLAVRGTLTNPVPNSTAGGFNYYGLLAGKTSGAISNCSAQGSLTIAASSSILLGGLVADIQSGQSIQNCWSDVDITVNTTSNDNQLFIGGICGYALSGTISSSYAIGNITVPATNISRLYVGGLVGLIDYSSVTINDCYARGTVKAGDNKYLDYIGGFAGNVNTASSTIQRCYSTGAVMLTGSLNCTGGGFAGNSIGIINDCYYDNSTSGQTGSFANGQSTALMKTGNFANWDFGSVWGVDPAINDGYPYLRCFGTNTVTP